MRGTNVRMAWWIRYLSPRKLSWWMPLVEVVALRYFIIRRSDESLAFQIGTFALAPVAGLWRLVLLRPLMVYAMMTFWRVGKWGTRGGVEVGASHAAQGTERWSSCHAWCSLLASCPMGE